MISSYSYLLKPITMVLASCLEGMLYYQVLERRLLWDNLFSLGLKTELSKYSQPKTQKKKSHVACPVLPVVGLKRWWRDWMMKEGGKSIQMSIMKGCHSALLQAVSLVWYPETAKIK